MEKGEGLRVVGKEGRVKGGGEKREGLRVEKGEGLRVVGKEGRVKGGGKRGKG